jgi:hypothetical protein
MQVTLQQTQTRRGEPLFALLLEKQLMAPAVGIDERKKYIIISTIDHSTVVAVYQYG